MNYEAVETSSKKYQGQSKEFDAKDVGLYSETAGSCCFEAALVRKARRQIHSLPIEQKIVFIATITLRARQYGQPTNLCNRLREYRLTPTRGSRSTCSNTAATCNNVSALSSLLQHLFGIYWIS